MGEILVVLGSGTLVWYLGVQAFALAGSVLASGWLRDLPDRGYAVGKALGVLLGTIVFWLILTARVLPNDRLAAFVALALTWGMAVVLGRRDSKPAIVWMIVVEIAFVLTFVGWTVVRAYRPEIWDGEKRMEIMMINAILRSEYFPPHDAWMVGYSLSYYYLGYVMLALLIKLGNLPSTVAFNLGHAAFFALTFTSAMGVGYALGARTVSRLDLRGVGAGAIAAVMLTLMGNLGGLLGILKCADLLPAQFWAWLDVREIATRTYECRGIVPAHFDWWWDWSRVVKDYALNGKPQIVITETPIFSFIIADNHPHVMALPFVVAVLGIAFAALRGGHLLQLNGWRESLAFVVLAAVLGSLSFLNAWDVPAYSAVFVAAAGLGAWQRKEPALGVMAKLAVMFLIGTLLFLPWRVTFAGQVHGIAANLFNGTRLPQFFVMFAPLLVLWVGLVVHGQSQLGVSLRAQAALIGLGVALLVVLILGAAGAAVFSGDSRTLLDEAFGTNVGELSAQGAQVRQRLLERLVNPWTALLLAVGIVSSAWLVWRSLQAMPAPFPAARVFALLLFAVGGLLTLGVELFYVRDPFGRRLNSVFKFYYQTWTLWSIAGALALIVLFETRQWFTRALGILASALVIAGMLWPAFAVPARTEFFARAPTLDGAQFLRDVLPDDAAIIEWLNRHVSGAPVIIEIGSIESFKPEGRISAFTGLPTVLGWGRHQQQWRGERDEVQRRKALVDQFYTTLDWQEARAILHEFNAQYVIVGNIEQERFLPESLAKFDVACQAVFEGIYKCN